MSTLPETVGAESLPYIDFRTDFEEDRTQSESSGRYVAKDVDIVILTPAGDNKTIIEEYVNRWLGNLKERLRSKAITKPYYDHCMGCYDGWKKNGEIPVHGTPIKGWAVLSPAQSENIIRANIRTVEDLAQCTEDGLQSIGMGARALKTKAVTWLQSAEDHGKVSQRMASLEADVETERANNTMLMEKLAELEAKISSSEPKKRR